MCNGQNITPRSRKEVLAVIRKSLPSMEVWWTFSDRRKDHQRVKWYGVFHKKFSNEKLIMEIKQILSDYGYFDITIDSVHNCEVWSIVFKFPYTWYY